jgi:substrate import-associated zinc metallohydrolase lipoprotein
MKDMKKIYYLFFALVLGVGLVSCSGDPANEPSIFDTSTPQRDELSQWLVDNFTYPYNVTFMYKWDYIETDYKYNLLPADSAKSAKLAMLTKYLWFDAYAEVAGADFIKANTPRVITLIGSPAYNSEGTELLGTAEGGYKVVLYKVNELTPEMLENYAALNYYYFHTMHHEFTHILNQKKPYNTDFDLISEKDYVSGDWYQNSHSAALKLGFISNYAMSEAREDFAEMAAYYVTLSESEWNERISSAGTTGKEIIAKKLEIVKKYFKESWGFELDDMRDAVIRRGSEISKLDLEHLN